MSTPQPTVLITGITGFVGMRIASTALDDGYKVRATLRDLKQKPRVLELVSTVSSTDNLEFAEADLLSDEGWEQAMDGVDYVIHTASPLILGAVDDENTLFGPAVDGTRRVLENAAAAQVKKIVVTSTALTIAGHITEGIATSKDFTPIDDPRVSLYTKSKIAAEQVVLDFVEKRQGDPDLITIHPGVVIGPPIDPNEDSESIGLFRGIWSGAQPAIPDIAFPMADVRDVAEVHLAALKTNDNKDSRYMVAFTTEPNKLTEIAKLLRESGNKKAPRFKIPMSVLRLLSRFNSALKTLVTSTDGLTLIIDISNTKADFDWTPMPFKQSVLDTASKLES